MLLFLFCLLLANTIPVDAAERLTDDVPCHAKPTGSLAPEAAAIDNCKMSEVPEAPEAPEAPVNSYLMDADALITAEDRKAIADFLKLYHSDDWEVYPPENDGLVISVKKGTDDHPLIVKGEIKVNRSPARVGEFLADGSDLQAIKSWDTDLLSIDIVDYLDEKHFALYGQWNVPLPLGIWSPRDYVFEEFMTRLPDGAFIALTKSVENPNYPPAEGMFASPVRGHLYLANFLTQSIENEPNACRIGYVVQTTVNGWIPKAVSNLMYKGLVQKVRNLKNVFDSKDFK